MSILIGISSILSVITLTPFIMLMFFIIFLASIGKSLGVRRMYVNLLVRIFEFGRQNIESVKGSPTGDEEEVDFHREKHENEINNKYEITKSHKKVMMTEEKKLNGEVKSLQNGNGNGIVQNGNSVISRDSLILQPEVDGAVKQEEKLNAKETKDNQEERQNDKTFEFQLTTCLDYVKAGMEAIIEDEVTSRFEAEELKNWNLLTRTNRHYEFISWRLTVIWVIGFLIRYFLLMPLRVLICFVGVLYFVIAFAIIGCVPTRKIRRKLNDYSFKIAFRIIARALSNVVTIHNPENKPKTSGFCVANHTSPIDVAILSADCTFSLIGQRHGGFLGVLQRALARASPHIWFERAEAKDRSAVARRLREHVSDPSNPPILIFPEGTCINNTSVMQFKKGSFEVGSVIYPVAIKYDPRFGDAFWNSSRYSMMQYLYMMMTSWAIVCDVWYLPAMHRRENESAIDFANRVKSVIAKQGGLVDLVWDGQLKRMKPKKEWKEKQQEEFSKRLKGHKRPYRYSTSPKAAPPIMCMIRSDTKFLRSRKESETKEKNCENSFEESKKIRWLPAEIIKVLGRKTFIVRIDPTRTIKRVTNNHSNSNNNHKNVIKPVKYDINDEDASAKTKEISNFPVYVVENEPETEVNGYNLDLNLTESQFIILDDLTNGVTAE